MPVFWHTNLLYRDNEHSDITEHGITLQIFFYQVQFNRKLNSLYYRLATYPRENQKESGCKERQHKYYSKEAQAEDEGSPLFGVEWVNVVVERHLLRSSHGSVGEHFSVT